MLTIVTDCPITRRKKIHMVVDEGGNLVLAAKSIEEAFVWLADQGHDHVILQATVHHHYVIDLTRNSTAALSESAPAQPPQT